MLTRQTLRGTWGTVLLPVAPDETIDLGRLADELAILVTAGLDGVYTNGTAGEFHCLEEDEYDLITDVVAQACQRAGVPVPARGEPHERADLAAQDPGGRRLRPGRDPGDPA